MNQFTSMQLGPDFAEALSGPTIYCDDDARLFRVRPPGNNSGIDASIDLLRSFHDYRDDESLLTQKNVSDTTGFELWYNNEELQFLYYTPSKSREEHYRRQLDGHFKGAQIDAIRERFVDAEAGEHIAGGEVWLKHHYFEPIRSPKNGVEEWNDPYLLLFSELDTRDSTRTLFQMLFKPAEEEWTRSRWGNVDSYAEKLKDTKVSKKYGGLVRSERDATSTEKDYASSITAQAGRPAFYVNIRYIVVGETEAAALEHADNLAMRLRVGYKETAGQTLETKPCKTTAEVSELVRKIAAREPSYMPTDRGLVADWKFNRFGDKSRKMVMTLPEIAGVIHFPKSKEVDIDAIQWTKQTITGKLPASARRFERLTDEQRIPQLQKWVVQQDKLLDELGLDPEKVNLTLGNPRDKNIEEEILSNPDKYTEEIDLYSDDD